VTKPALDVPLTLSQTKEKTMSKRQHITRELKANPHLERALAAQLVAMGFVIKQALPLYQRFERIPEHILGGVFDTIAGTPRAAAKGVCGIFNLVEDVVFGTVNSIGPGPKTPSYRQSLIDAKKRRGW